MVCIDSDAEKNVCVELGVRVFYHCLYTSLYVMNTPEYYLLQGHNPPI